MDEHIRKQLELLNQQVKEMSGFYHSAASKLGISDGEFWVWYALLVLDGEHSQQSICEMWSLPRQTVNSVVSNLVKKEYLFLETVPGTRNRKNICLTEAGKKYGEGIVQEIYSAEQRAFAGMSEQERQMCIELLGKYAKLLKDEFDKV